MEDRLAQAVAFARGHIGPVSAASILLLSVLMLALDITGFWGLAVHPLGPSPWWGLLTIVPGCLLVAVRPRWPFATLVLGAVLFVVDLVSFGTVGQLFIINDLIYNATSRLSPRGRRRMIALLIALTAVTLTIVGSATGDARSVVLAGLVAFALLGTPIWWATNVRQAQELAELHEQRADDAARLAALREHEAVREERERMARDLHDVIAGHLSAVALRSEAALAREPHEEKDRAALAAVREASVRSLDEMRSMILLLRSGAEPVAAAPRLEGVADLLTQATASGLQVTWDAEPLPALPAAVDQAAARIVQESLVNAAKHAAGGEVDVRLRSRGGELAIEVASRGGRATDAGGAGLGLLTMRERAEALGGRFSAGPDDHGWTVRADLPAVVRA